MSSVVLVHGAWSDGSIWADVIETLQADDHDVVAVQLPLTSLEDDVAWTRRQIDLVEGPVTLVGHSYGGVVISAAADAGGKVTSLVFVAAYAPDLSETIPALSDRGGAMPGRHAIVFGDDGWTTLDTASFHDALGADLPPARTRILAATQKPTHVRCLVTGAPRGAWHDLPSSYLVCADDRILDPDLQRWFAERSGATTYTLASGHLAPVSHPAEVAAIIAAATRTGSRPTCPSTP